MTGPVFGTTLLSGIERLLADLRVSTDAPQTDILGDLLGAVNSLDTDDVPTNPATSLYDLMASLIPDAILPVEPVAGVTSGSFIDTTMKDIIDDFFESVFGSDEPAPVVRPTEVTSIFDLFDTLPDAVADLLSGLEIPGSTPEPAPADTVVIGSLRDLIGVDLDEIVFKGNTLADLALDLSVSKSGGPDLPTGSSADIVGADSLSVDGPATFWDDFIF